MGLEGKVGGFTAKAALGEISRIARGILAEPDSAAARVREWILQYDGDYVVTLTDGKRLLVFTDPLGRLPLYFHASDVGVLLGRECKFLTTLRGTAEFDRLGWAEHLWVGYPLGPRTLFAGVSRAPSGFLLQAEAHPGRVDARIESLFDWNLDEKDERDLGVRRHASELADAFEQGIMGRVERGGSSPVIVSLSGGHDSRSVAAGLARVHLDFAAVTFRSSDPASRLGWADAAVAKRIATELGVPWELVELPDSDPHDERRLVRMKDGLNYVGVAFLLKFLEALVERFGASALYVTGDGGDKFLPDLRPPGIVRTERELLETVVAQHTRVPARAVEDLVGLPPGCLHEELVKILAGYPERDMVQKSVHFKLSERGRKWLFEGEDRNRFFLWQVSPFYALPFARLAVRVPDHWKKDYRLYREFQRQLNPRLLRIPHPGVRLPIGSPLFGWALKARAVLQRIPSRWKRRLKRLLGVEESPLQVPNRAVEFLKIHTTANSAPWSSPRGAAEMLSERESRGDFYTWWTLALLEQEIAGRDAPRSGGA